MCADAVIGNVQEKTIKHFNAPNAEVVCICVLHDCGILEYVSRCVDCDELNAMFIYVPDTVALTCTSVLASLRITH